MKRLNHIGKIIVAIGVLSIFRKDEGFYGFGGYVDNTWGIITVSLVIIITGISLILISKKYLKKE
jgi:hypothetical protein